MQTTITHLPQELLLMILEEFGNKTDVEYRIAKYKLSNICRGMLCMLGDTVLSEAETLHLIKEMRNGEKVTQHEQKIQELNSRWSAVSRKEASNDCG